MRVRVWFNLHRRVWSIKEGSEPVRHADYVRLVGVAFRVSEAARQRVLRERRRSVHAYALGVAAGPAAGPPAGAVRISYNPYRGRCFYRPDGGGDVAAAEEVYFLADGTAWAVNPRGG